MAHDKNGNLHASLPENDILEPNLRTTGGCSSLGDLMSTLIDPYSHVAGLDLIRVINHLN